jgi:hypothetical protein
MFIEARYPGKSYEEVQQLVADVEGKMRNEPGIKSLFISYLRINSKCGHGRKPISDS